MGQLLVVNFGEIKNWTKIDVIQGCLFLNTLPLAVYLHIGMVLKTLPLAVSCQDFGPKFSKDFVFFYWFY